MKKLLLLASLALTALGVWAQDDEVTEYQVIVNSDNGDIYRNGSLDNAATAAQKWVSTIEGVPQVTFAEKDNRNNLTFVGNVNLGYDEIYKKDLALYCSSVNYTAFTEDGWYVSKIAFDALCNNGNATLAVNRINYVISGASTNTLEFEFAFGDEIILTLTGGSKYAALDNFVITLKKITKDDLLVAALGKYNFEMYPQFWSAESAQEANEAIENKYNELIDDENYTLNQIYNKMIEVADNYFDKLCREEVSGKYFTFQNRDTGRFLAVGQTEEGEFESQSIEDGNDQHAIWYLGYDDEQNKFRLHNYETNYDLMNTNSVETQIPVAPHEDMDADAPGALFSILPVRFKENGEYVYIVEFKDAVENGNYHYIHDSTGNIPNTKTPKYYPVKWNDAEGSIGSGWFASLKDVNPDGALAGLLALDKSDVVIYNLTQNKYLTGMGDGTIGYSDNLRPTGVWKFLKHLDGHDDENFAIYNEVEKKYAVDLTKAMTASRNSNLKVDNVEGKFETWHIFNRGGSAADADEFIISSFSYDYQNMIMADLKAMYAYEMGDEPGMYRLGDDAKEQAYNEMKESVASIVTEDGFDLEKAQAAFDFEAGATPEIFSLNDLEGVALVRIKTIPENDKADIAYFSNTNYTNASGANALAFNNSSDANENENTIYVLHEGKLSSYVGGRYLKTNESAVAINIWESEDVSENEGLTMDFVDGSHKVVGAYVLHYADYNNGANRAYVFSDGIGANRGAATEAQGWLAQLDKQSNWYGYYFNVEFVKTLAVDVDENGYKLWRTPVTVNFGDNANNGAYVVSVNGTEIKTTAADKETNYGAGTIFVLTKNIVANVVNGDATLADTAGLGHHAAKAHDVSAEKVYLELHPDQSPEVAPAGLYYDAVDDVEKVRMAVKMYDADQTVELVPHSAVIEADKDETTELKDGDTVMLPLGASYVTTSISELTAEKPVNSIYDLQGRRLAAPRKGINIVNGKKIVL